MRRPTQAPLAVVLAVTVSGCASQVEIEASGPGALCVAAGSWEPAAPMRAARWLPELVATQDGGALAIGGRSDGELDATIERYDAKADAWSELGVLSEPRQFHTATVLDDGRVLVVGGYTGTPGGSGSGIARVETIDPKTGVVGDTTPMPTGRYLHAATRLPSGAILVAGGFTADAPELPPALLFDPVHDTWRAIDAPDAVAGGFVTIAASRFGAWVISHDGVRAFDEATETFTLTKNPLPEDVASLDAPRATATDSGGVAVVDVAGFVGIAGPDGDLVWRRIWNTDDATTAIPVILGVEPLCGSVVVSTDERALEVDLETGVAEDLERSLGLGVLTRLTGGALLSVGGDDPSGAPGSAAARVFR